MRLDTFIAQKVQCPIQQIARGKYARVYRAIDDPTLVYILVAENDPSKEILSHIQDIPHIPTLQYIDAFEYKNKDYTLWQTEYTRSPKKADGESYQIARRLRKLWNEHMSNNRRSYTETTRQYNDRRYSIVADFIDIVKADDHIPESIGIALEYLYGWAVNYGPNFWLEFPPRNLGVNSTGELILRDILFFVD